MYFYNFLWKFNSLRICECLQIPICSVIWVVINWNSHILARTDIARVTLSIMAYVIGVNRSNNILCFVCSERSQMTIFQCWHHKDCTWPSQCCDHNDCTSTSQFWHHNDCNDGIIVTAHHRHNAGTLMTIHQCHKPVPVLGWRDIRLCQPVVDMTLC